MSVKSILIINDYLTLCSLTDRRCRRSLLVRNYLNYKISKKLELTKSEKNNSNFLYLILVFLFIR
jgi:hypothetical protein